MDALPEAEMEAVRLLAQNNPEIAAEILSIEESLETYAAAGSIQPKNDLKEKILNKIKVETFDTKSIRKEPIVKTLNPEQKSSSSFYKYAAAASISLLVLSTLFNVFVWKKLQSTEKDLASATSEKQEYASQLNQVKNSYNQTLADLGVLRNKDYTSVAMNGLALAPEALVKVYWNKKTKETYLDISSLPIPPQGKQYQLWALVGGKPVDAGVFNALSELQKVKNVESAQAFAVTLEPIGGSASPTLTAMYVMGNV